MCDCGCNTCDIKPLMLNESLAPREILSEGLKYHMDNNKPLTEHVYRAGSQNYFNLWAEARSLYTRGILEITHEDDLAVLTETDLGHYGMFEGKKVPLDFPIEITEAELNEVTRYSGFLRNPEDPDSEKFEPTGSVAQFKEDLRALFGKFKDDLKNPEFIKGVAQIMVNWKSLLRSQLDEKTFNIFESKILKNGDKYLGYSASEQIYYVKDSKTGRKVKHTENAMAQLYGIDWKEQIDEAKNKNRIIVKTNGKRLAIDREDLQRLKSGKDVVGYSTKHAGQQEWILANDEWEIEGPLNEAKKKYKKGDKLKVKLKNGKEFDITFDSYSSNKGIAFGKIDGDRKPFSLDAVVNEAKKKKKKDPPIGKPMRSSSGGKAYKVYVRDPKTKKVKTVRFGSGGLRAKINDPKARQAFAKRHKCSTKKDKTKASYWSCRLPRYAKLLGLKSSFSGFW